MYGTEKKNLLIKFWRIVYVVSSSMEINAVCSTAHCKEIVKFSSNIYFLLFYILDWLKCMCMCIFFLTFHYAYIKCDYLLHSLFDFFCGCRWKTGSRVKERTRSPKICCKLQLSFQFCSCSHRSFLQLFIR